MRLVLAAIILAALASLAHAADVPATSQIQAVTVYLSGAEITRLARVKLEKGEHTVVLGDVPASAVPGSIRVVGKATGKLAIGSVDTTRKLLQRAESAAADAERKILEDELEKLRDERSVVEAEAQAADTQKALIANLAQLPTRPVGSTGTMTGGEDWPRVLSVIAQGSQEAGRLSLEAQRKLRDLDRRIEDVDKKLAALPPPRTQQTEVRVYVEAETPLDADLTIRYQVPSASWAPIYDARLKTGNKTEPPKLNLARRAAITQRTGEAWNDVALTLSTSRPSESAALPHIDTQLVDFEPEVKPAPPPAPMARLDKGAAEERARRDNDAAQAGAPTVAMEAQVPEAEPITETVATMMSAPFEANFAVPGRVSIADTGEVKRVVLLNDVVEPGLSSRTVPKLETNAYLYAKFNLGKGTPLLPGKVYLFRDDAFVGTGDLPLLQPGEEHRLGFGVDDLVKVRYAVIEEKRGETGLISTSSVDSRNYRVTVKNLHERPIDVTVIDRIPISKNQEIKIEYTGKTQPTNPNLDDKRGVLAFEKKLEPDQEEVLEYGYRISWPAAKSIVYGP